jgi:putative transposase
MDLVESIMGAPSVRAQCRLLSVSRSGYYYEACPEHPENLRLMRRMDELHLRHPVYGSPRLTAELRREGWEINRKRVVRLMGVMGIEAIYPKANRSQPGPGHEIYPYLLRGKTVTGPDQVWSSDITYIPMRFGFMYLVAVMDWWSRFVLAWRLSNTMESAFCVTAWKAALHNAQRLGRLAPAVSNTDQGSQFTSAEYIEAVETAEVRVSMDGRGRCLDNVFIERLWRSLKYEDIYLRDYEDGRTLAAGVGKWFSHYNDCRPHQALNYSTPGELYRSPESYGAKPAAWVQNLNPNRFRC